MKDVLDFSKEPTMIRRELLGSRAILAVVSVTPPFPGKHLFSTHTDTKATRQHLGRLEATVLEPSPFFPLYDPFHLNLLSHQYTSTAHSFRGLPISQYRKSNSWSHVNILGLSVYRSAFPIRLPVLHSPILEAAGERENNIITDTLKYHNVSLHFIILW